jgi:hypothetical protein
VPNTFKDIVSRDGVSTETIGGYLGLNILTRINFMPERLRVKKELRINQGGSRCKTAGTGIHSLATFHAQMCTTDCGNPQCHTENSHTADCHSQ